MARSLGGASYSSSTYLPKLPALVFWTIICLVLSAVAAFCLTRSSDEMHLFGAILAQLALWNWFSALMRLWTEPRAVNTHMVPMDEALNKRIIDPTVVRREHLSLIAFGTVLTALGAAGFLWAFTSNNYDGKVIFGAFGAAALFSLTRQSYTLLRGRVPKR